MTGFLRALKGELYLLRSRRSIRRAHFLVAIVAILHVVGSYFILQAQAGVEDLKPEDIAGWNFWPRVAASSRAAMYFVEVVVLALIAGSFPSEISGGVARDPLVRRISRPALTVARSLAAMVLPLTLYGVAVGFAWMTSAALFDGGPILDEGDIIFEEEDVAKPVKLALLHGVPAILALGAFAVALSVAFRKGVVAVGVGLGIVLSARILHEPLGESAPWFFADTLAGLGPDSFLEQAAGFSLGLSNYYPESFDAVVAKGWYAPLPTLAAFIIAALLLFRRRSL
jgi:hypothetical protein